MSNSTVDARLSLIHMLWEKVSENKRNWISLTEMNRHTLSAPLSCSCSSAVLGKVIMFRWITDFRTDKRESKTHHTHSVIPYISQLWYKRERRLFNYSHRGENENTITTLMSCVLGTTLIKSFWSLLPGGVFFFFFCCKIRDLSLCIMALMYYVLCILYPSRTCKSNERVLTLTFLNKIFS